MNQLLLRSTLLTVIFLGLFAVSAYAQRLKYHRIEAAVSNEQFQGLMTEGLGIDHFQYSNGVLKAEVSDADISLMEKYHIQIKYIIRDIERNLAAYNAKIDQQALQNPAPSARTFPTPVHFGTGGTYGPAGGVAGNFTFTEMQNQLDQMRALYPNLITVKSSIGTTDEGRPIYMVKISDNADINENEPQIFLNAVHHAREPIGMTQLIFFMWYALENYNTDKEITTLLNSSEIYIIPCVNPDGYVYNATTNSTGGGMWRKNRHNNGNGTYGVDNNRNYSYGWGGSGSSSTTSSDTYQGSAPFSEKENIAVKNFINAHQFVSELNYHSYGNYCIYPYSTVSVNNNPEVPLFTQLSVLLTEDNGFTYGNSQATVNYVATGVAEDWAYAEQTTKPKVYGFTPEIGNSTDGFYPASSRIIPLCNSMMVMNLNLLKVSTKYGLVTTAAPAINTDYTGTLPFTLKNFSIYPANYTVALTPLSAYVTGVDPAKIISSSTVLQNIPGQFNFTIEPNTPEGSLLSFVLSTDNGYHTRYDTLSITFTCPAPVGSTTSITSSSASLSWSNINGATAYYISSKTASATTWGTEVLVQGSTGTTLTGLNPGTAYNWRVRNSSCVNYSATQSFTTFGTCSTPAPTATSLTPTGFTLTWPVVSGVSSYVVQIRLQGTAAWTSSTVTTNSKVVTGLTVNNVYEYQVSSNCTVGVSAFSPVKTVATSYCSSYGTNNAAEWIDNIQLATITRTSGKETGGYVNTGITTNLVRGVKYTLTYSAGFASTIYKEYWKVYIDYNHDGDFADNGENVASTAVTGAGNFTVSFTVPTTALLTSTRMRVMMSRTSISNSCSVLTTGEVEDYNINLVISAEIYSRAPAMEINGEKPVENNIDWVARVNENPFRNEIRISFGKQNVNQMNVTLLNMMGAVVYKQTLNAGVLSHNINTSLLPQGVYFLLIDDGKTRKSLKMLK